MRGQKARLGSLRFRPASRSAARRASFDAMKRTPIDTLSEIPEPHGKASSYDHDSIDESLERLAVRRRRVPASVESGVAYHAPAHAPYSANDTLSSEPPVILDSDTDRIAHRAPKEAAAARETAPAPQRARARPFVIALLAGIVVVACFAAWRVSRPPDPPRNVHASTPSSAPAIATIPSEPHVISRFLSRLRRH